MFSSPVKANNINLFLIFTIYIIETINPFSKGFVVSIRGVVYTFLFMKPWDGHRYM